MKALTMVLGDESSASSSATGHSRRVDGPNRNSSVASLSAIEEDGDSVLRGLSQSYGDADLRRRLQEVVDGDLAKDRQRQVDDLASKVLALESDRERAKEELEQTEQQYRHHVQNAKAQLEEIRNEHGRMVYELENLGRMLLEAKSSSNHDRQRQEQEADDRNASLEAELQRLTEIRGSSELKIGAMQEELQTMKQQLESFHSKRVRVVEESGVSAQSAQELRQSLESAKHRLTESEQQRARLRDRYLNAGQSFEQVLGVAEKEKHEILADWEQELTLNRNRCEKYKVRLEEAETELQAVEAKAASHKETLGTNDADIARLQGSLDSERALQRQHEAQHFEWQQQQLHVQNTDIQNLSEMISLAAHEKLLNDQAVHYGEKVKELERRLQQEGQVSPNVSPRPARGRQSNSQSRESRAFSPPGRGGAGLPNEGTRQGVCDEGVRQAKAKASKLESEARQVKEAHQRVEAVAARADEQRQALATSLAEAHSHLARLQRIVDDEKWAGQDLQMEASEAKAEADAAAAEVASHAASFRAARSEAVESEKLNIAVRDQSRKIAGMEESLEQLHSACHSHELEVSVLQGEQQTLSIMFESAEKHTSEMQAQHSSDLVRYSRHREAARSIQQLLKRHVKESRIEVQQLRADMQSELRQLQERCQEQGRQCLRSLQVQRFNSGLESSAHRKVAEDARRRSEDLEQQLAIARGEESVREQRLAELSKEEAQHKETHSETEHAIREHQRAIDNILMTVGTFTLDGPNFGPARIPMFGCDTVSGADLAMPELLVQLRTKLDATFLRARGSGEQVERQECEARLAAEAQRGVNLCEQRMAVASSKMSDLEARRDSVALEVKRVHSREEAGLREHTALLLQLDAEMREREAELREARHHLQDEESKAADISACLQRTAVPSSETIASWRAAATEPLKKELSGMLAELEQLQRRYAHGWDEKEKDWTFRCTRSEEAHREKALHTEMRLRDEASFLRVRLEEQAQQARETTLAVEKRVSGLRERLRESQADADDRKTAARLLQSECSIASEDEQHAQCMLEQAEAHHAELEESRQRDRSRTEELELQARSQRERELAELRRAEAAEAARMRSFLQQTLSTISAAATLDETPSRSLAKDQVPLRSRLAESRGGESSIASISKETEWASPSPWG